MQEFDEIWDAAIEELRKTTSDVVINLWYKVLKLVDLTDTQAVFYTDSAFKRERIEKNFSASIAQTLEAVLGYRVEPVFTSADGEGAVVGSDKPADNSHDTVSVGENKAEETESEPKFIVTDGDSPVDVPSEYTFDNFIVGTSNNFAHAVCLSVAKLPAPAAANKDASMTIRESNPLFIYGPSGLGKTHLMFAMINEIKKNYPNYKVVYVKGDEFTNQMVDSINAQNPAQFREKFRKADVLFIDDIHFIAGRDGTQEEFFNTFNDLHQHNKQIILTSDKPPKDISRLEERLRTRFEWGMIADIQPPDFELRVAIMAKKAEKLGMPLPIEVLNYLAEHLTNNVRQMEGALKRIIMYSVLNKEPVSIPMVNTCISDLIVNNGAVHITPEKIVTKVADKYKISEKDICSNSRVSSIAKARHLCVYLMVKLLSMSYSEIGRFFKKKDHTSALNSFKWIENEIRNNAVFEIEINDLIKEIQT
jgi:chromosomal replication initiator protein